MKTLIFALLLIASPLSAQYSKAKPDTRVLIVENNNWSDVAIYAVHISVKQRIGTVTALSKAKFHLPPRFFRDDGSLRIYARPIGGGSAFGDGAHTTESLRVRMGGEALLTLSVDDLSRSFFSVWNP